MSDAVLIVGLGNPGPEYERTRHNLGYRVVEHLCDRLGARLRPVKGVRAVAGDARAGDTRVILAEPTTYMNLSGEAVGPLARYYKVDPSSVIVVHDDLDLPLGRVRLKRGGGDGGHNGLGSISRSLKTKEYVRVRIGIGRPPGRQDPADYVLQAFGKRDAEEVEIAVREAADAAMVVIEHGLDEAQRRHHPAPDPPKPARAIRLDVTVPASPGEVFDAWTTSEGATTFFAPQAHIDLRKGGAYEMLFQLDEPEGSRGSEGCTIAAFERPRFLVFTWNAPPSIPVVRAGRKTRVEITIEPSGAASRVTLTQSGWKNGPEWDEAFAYFSSAWRVVLDRLRARFETGPIDWERTR